MEKVGHISTATTTCVNDPIRDAMAYVYVFQGRCCPTGASGNSRQSSVSAYETIRERYAFFAESSKENGT